jgi:hypothetical protein
LAAVYGTIAFCSNAITTRFMTDQWGRRKYVTRHAYVEHSMKHLNHEIDIGFVLVNQN